MNKQALMSNSSEVNYPPSDTNFPPIDTIFSLENKGLPGSQGVFPCSSLTITTPL